MCELREEAQLFEKAWEHANRILETSASVVTEVGHDIVFTSANRWFTI